MACRLFGAKQLSKPMQDYCRLDRQEQTSMKFESELYHFIKSMHLKSVVCQTGGHFVLGKMN